MAFSISGIFNRIWRPRLCGPICHGPDAGSQMRGYAARKGTREKALKIKRAQKLKKAAEEARKKNVVVTKSTSSEMKTVEVSLPPPPSDFNVYFSKFYKPAEYSILEAIDFHKEDLHPSVLHQPGATIDVFIELNMTAEKKTRTLRPWSQVIVYPYPFGMGIKKKVLVICPDDEKVKALEAGADFAGGNTLLKDIKKGTFDIAGFDCIIGSVSLHEDINLIRAHLKLLHPKRANGTLTDDIVEAVKKIKYGMQYTAHLGDSEDKFGWIKLNLGKLDMNPEEVEKNFEFLIRSIDYKRPKREGDFIKHVYTICNPSKERIKINFLPYLDRSERKESIKSKENEENDVSVAVSN